MTTKSIDIVVDSKQADKALRRTTKNAKDLGREFDKTSESGFRLSKVAGGISAALAVQKVVAYADAWSNVQSQLKLATKTTEDLTRVTDKLLTAANETRSSFEATANLYAKLERSTRQLALSENELLEITKAVTQSFVISGATTNEAQASITQFAQALASGVLRGDEFNSIAEQAPRLMQAFADATGKTTGELRALAAQGRITADVVVQSIQSQASAIENDFGKTIPTVSQSITQLSDAILSAVGRFDQITGASSSFASFLGEISNDINVLLSGKSNVKSLTDDLKDLQTQLISQRERGAPESVLNDTVNKMREIRAEIKFLESEVSQSEIFKGLDLFGGNAAKAPSKKVAIPTTTKTSGINIEQTRAALKAETQAIIEEADIRRAFRDGEINQRQLDEEIGLQRIYYDYERRRIAIDENEKLTDIQKAQLKLELAEQEVAAEELLQANLTSAAEKGAKDRERVSMLEQNARIDNLQQGAGAALNLIGAFGKKSFQAQKNLAIADGIVNIASGVTKALNNPYPANLAFAAQVAAQGAALIGTIKSTNIGGTGSAPSSGSISAPQAAIPNFDSGQPNSFEISGVSKVLDSINPDTLYSGDVVQKLFESFEQYERRGG